MDTVVARRRARFARSVRPAFEQRYLAYEEQTRNGELKLFKRIKAADLWRKMLSMLFETGHPWITFKDTCNVRSPQQHTGVVHSSNLCTEITLNTSADEIAVCNLGSINLVQHIENGELNLNKLEQTTRTAVRMLDNVIDINYYSVDQARTSNMRHRPVGLGLMGFQDALYKLGLAYGSDAAVEFADTSMEAISYYAIDASSNLAQERGAYASFAGSLWSRGILPIDSIKMLQAERGEGFLEVDLSSKLIGVRCAAKCKLTVCVILTLWRLHQRQPLPISPEYPSPLNRPIKIFTSNRICRVNSPW